MQNPTVSDGISVEERVIHEVRRHLKRQRWSARQAALALGWNEMYISRRLSMKTPFDLRDLGALAALLEVSVIDFFVPLEELPRGVNSVAGRTRVQGGSKPNYSFMPLTCSGTESGISGPVPFVPRVA